MIRPLLYILSYRPYKDTWRRCPSESRGERPQERLNLLPPWSWTSSLHKWEEIHFCCLSTQSVGLCYGSPKLTIGRYQWNDIFKVLKEKFHHENVQWKFLLQKSRQGPPATQLPSYCFSVELQRRKRRTPGFLSQRFTEKAGKISGSRGKTRYIFFICVVSCPRMKLLFPPVSCAHVLGTYTIYISGVPNNTIKVSENYDKTS